MLVLKKLAITGSPGVGKSTICQLFQGLGVPTFSTDVMSHEILAHDENVRKELLLAFGSGIVTDGQIDRDKLGSLVFQDSSQLRILESILHPAIRRKVVQILDEEEKIGTSFIVGEVPLLFEAGWDVLFDTVVFVSAPQSWNDNDPMGLRRKRMWPEAAKRVLADFWIFNSGSIAELKDTVIKLWNQIKSVP